MADGGASPSNGVVDRDLGGVFAKGERGKHDLSDMAFEAIGVLMVLSCSLVNGSSPFSWEALRTRRPQLRLAASVSVLLTRASAGV